MSMQTMAPPAAIAAAFRPPRNRTTFGLSVAGALSVVLSYALTLVLVAACFGLTAVICLSITSSTDTLIVWRILLALFGIGAGLSILWSMLPRRQKFVAPGVLIDLAREPRLAREIEAISTALNEPMPSEVYLVPNANAFVIERGGFLGIRRRRIMGLGLPLMQMLSVTQFRAVLAHEFAHYYSGDTRLGPWVYNARVALVRVFNNLGRDSVVMPILTRHIVVAIPYRLLMEAIKLYWKGFIRLSQLISRHQEYRSDEIACLLVGPDAFVEGLALINKCDAGIASYWQNLVVPMASRGYQPPVAEGFLRFMNAPQVASAASAHLEKVAANSTVNPLDTHPPFAKRVERARLHSIAAPPLGTASDVPMVSLIDHIDGLELELLKRFVPDAKANPRALQWANVGEDFYLPLWRQALAPFLTMLSTRTIAELPEIVADRKAIADKIANPPGLLLNNKQRYERAGGILGYALAATLRDHGWALSAEPGHAIIMRAGDLTVEPINSVVQMGAGTMTRQQWQEFCANAGIGEYFLGSSSTTAHGN